MYIYNASNEQTGIGNGRFPVHDGTMKPGAKRGDVVLAVSLLLLLPSLLPWLRMSWKPGRRLGEERLDR